MQRAGIDGRVRRTAPWALVLLIAVSTSVAGVLFVLNTKSEESGWEVFFGVLATGVGFVLATRRGENPIGWLLLLLGCILGLSAVAFEYATYGLLQSDDPLPGARLAAVYDQATWPLLFAPVAAIAFVFPDGRLPSSRWRKVAIGALGFCVLSVVLMFLGPRDFEKPFEAFSSPLPQMPEAIFFPLFIFASLGLVASLLAAALAMRTRKRRPTGTELQQIKLVAYTAALVPLAVAIGWTEPDRRFLWRRGERIGQRRADRDPPVDWRRGHALPPLRG